MPSPCVHASPVEPEAYIIDGGWTLVEKSEILWRKNEFTALWFAGKEKPGSLDNAGRIRDLSQLHRGVGYQSIAYPVDEKLLLSAILSMPSAGFLQ